MIKHTWGEGGEYTVSSPLNHSGKSQLQLGFLSEKSGKTKKGRMVDQPKVQSGYPPVTVNNSTPYVCKGTVEYASALCRNDNYIVTPGRGWTAGSRGVCLVTGINATVETLNGDVKASPYTSSGTSYSNFAIIQAGVNQYAVTRITDLSEEFAVPDYVEPTEQQK
jgi:hypothetical protein